MTIIAEPSGITFRSEDFRAMAFKSPGALLPSWEVVLYTNVWPGGKIFRYQSKAEVTAVTTYIQEALTKEASK